MRKGGLAQWGDSIPKISVGAALTLTLTLTLTLIGCLPKISISAARHRIESIPRPTSAAWPSPVPRSLWDPGRAAGLAGVGATGAVRAVSLCPDGVLHILLPGPLGDGFIAAEGPWLSRRPDKVSPGPGTWPRDHMMGED